MEPVPSVEPCMPPALDDAEAAVTRLPLVDEFDTPTEVDAIFRTQRRVAIGYFVLFLLVVFAIPALTVLVPWWSESRLLGGMSPGFVMAAVGLYLFFFAIAIAAATLANAVEDAMLGTASDAPTDGEDGAR